MSESIWSLREELNSYPMRALPRPSFLLLLIQIWELNLSRPPLEAAAQSKAPNRVRLYRTLFCDITKNLGFLWFKVEFIRTSSVDEYILCYNLVYVNIAKYSLIFPWNFYTFSNFRNLNEEFHEVKPKRKEEGDKASTGLAKASKKMSEFIFFDRWIHEDTMNDTKIYVPYFFCNLGKPKN